MKPRKCTKIWTCKDGTKVRVCDMTDSHLRNTIALFERQAGERQAENLSAAYSCLSMFQGEMAIMECENAISAMEDDMKGFGSMPDVYWSMIDEEARRKLKTKNT